MDKLEAEKKYFKLLAGMGFCLNMIEDLKETPFYSQVLKNKLNNAFKEMDNQERFFTQRGQLEAKEWKDMCQQLQDSYEFFESWIDTAFKIPVSRHEIFTNYVNIGVKQYEI